MRPLPVAFLVLLAIVPAAAAPEEPREPGPDEMARANRAAGLLVLERLRAESPDDHRRLVRCPPRRVVVVPGRYDHVERILAPVVPLLTLSPDALGSADLRAARLLVLDCPADLDEAGLRAVRRFVEEGGHLLTTDWASERVLQVVFPGTVRFTGRPTRDDVVPVRVLDPGHPYFRGALRPGRAPLWWLENRSFPVRVLDRGRVQVLVDSPEMGRRYGEPAIVLTFPWRRGRVVHLVSHAYLQRSEAPDPWYRRSAAEFAEELGLGPETPAGRRLKDEGLDRVPCGEVYSAYSIQRFLLNVVLEALRAEPPPPPPPPARPRPEGTPATVVSDSVLRDDPDGRPILAVARGLRVVVLLERDGWALVRTPAGQTGWIRRQDL